MTFFYDLNKRLDGIRATPETTHGQLNERDEGKPGKTFAKIAKDAGERYGSKAAGERVAGAVRNKLAKAGKLEEQDMDESAFQAAIGKKKYGDEGMKALQKAGRDHASDSTMDNIRNKYDKYDEGVFQGGPDKSKIPAYQRPNDPLTMKDLEKERTQSPTSAEGMRALQDKLSKIHPMDETMDETMDEAAKWRDPKYKDKLYTQEPRDYDQYDYGDDDYYNPKPADYPGEKNLKGGGEFSHNDPLQKGQGIGRSGIKHSILDRGPRKGLPSRDQITSLKGSIKSARGTHARPNLPEAGAPMTPKQKSFAKLAPPADKITFADKIVGAKKEVDEMLGDVAAKAMRSAIAGNEMEEGNDFTGARLAAIRAGKPTFKVGGKSYRVSGDTSDEKAMVEDDKEDLNPFTNYKKPRRDTPRVGDVEHGSKHDIKHTATGRVVTRRTDDQGISVGSETDDEGNKHEKRGKGRPAGSKKAIGAKGPSGKSKLMTKESEVSTGNLQKMHQLISALKAHVTDPDGLATLKELSSLVKHYVTQGSGQELDEKAVSKKQQKFMGMVHATQKGEKAPSKEVAKVAKSMKKSDAEDFAATKHKGLPEKAKAKKEESKEEVEETTVAGSVAPAAGGASKGKGGMTFGKGVYEGAIAESFNAKLDSVLTEGMNMNMSTDSEGHNSLTVTATDEDATSLAEILKMAGLGGNSSGYKEACPDCGSTDCGCDHVEEDLANSANNTMYADTDTMINKLSGGLNARKTTGQTTGAPFNRQPSRQGAMTEETEQKLWNLFKKY